jgi:hypothetical protein
VSFLNKTPRKNIAPYFLISNNEGIFFIEKIFIFTSEKITQLVDLLLAIALTRLCFFVI